MVRDAGNVSIEKISFEYTILSELELIFDNDFGLDPVAIIKF